MQRFKPVVDGRRGGQKSGGWNALKSALESAECIALRQQHQQSIETLDEMMTAFYVQQL